MNACFATNGKCHKCNPDRGTQYGWINNNAQDTWWWLETSCGVIFLPKKYTSESDSDYMRSGETKLLYDAVGRKTAAHPETRRLLFSPKKTLNEKPKPVP